MHLGRETTIQAGGKQYRLSKFDRSVWVDFMSWAGTRLPDPLDMIRDKLTGFPKELQEIMVKEAMAKASCPRSINSPEVTALRESPEGAMQIMTLLLKRHHPELTEDQAWNVFELAAEEHGEGYLQDKLGECAGQSPATTEPAGVLQKKRKAASTHSNPWTGSQSTNS